MENWIYKTIKQFQHFNQVSSALKFHLNYKSEYLCLVIKTRQQEVDTILSETSDCSEYYTVTIWTVYKRDNRSEYIAVEITGEKCLCCFKERILTNIRCTTRTAYTMWRMKSKLINESFKQSAIRSCLQILLKWDVHVGGNKVFILTTSSDNRVS